MLLSLDISSQASVNGVNLGIFWYYGIFPLFFSLDWLLIISTLKLSYEIVASVREQGSDHIGL